MEREVFRMHCWELQVEEVDAVRSYWGECCHISGGFQAAKDALDASPSRGEALARLLADLPPISIALSPPPSPSSPHGSQLRISAELPRTYPLSSPPHLSASSPGLSRNAQHRLHAAIPTFLASLSTDGRPWPTEGCMIQALQWLHDTAHTFSDRPSDSDQPVGSEHRGGVATNLSPAAAAVVFRRAVLWFHHIYSTEKRRHIVDWARQANLTGASRPGKPGLVFVEGSPDSVALYITRLRGLQWQKMSVAADEIDSRPPSLRSFQEVACDNLTDLLPMFKEAGVEHMFYEATGVPQNLRSSTS